MDNSFFAGVSAEQVKLSNGVRIGLPVRYYDWSGIMAHFPVPTAALKKLLPTNKLKPVQLVPGTAILSLAAMEYRQIADVAPYNEFGIMVPVLYEPTVNILGLPLLFPHWFKRFGLYVHHLPVTTQSAYDFGVEIWGYPKIIAQISFEETNQSRRCRLQAEGKDIVTLEIKKMATKAGAMNYYTYTVKDGQLLMTKIQAQGQIGIARFRGGAAYTLGDHPIAEKLRALGLGETAVERLYAPQVQSMLHPASERLPLI
jgi:Acetoacetate decarboxylase (ADC)